MDIKEPKEQRKPIQVTREVFHEYLKNGNPRYCDCSIYVGHGGHKYCLNSCPDCPEHSSCDYHCFWNADEQNWIEWCMCTSVHNDYPKILEKSKELEKINPPLPKKVLYIVSK